MVLGSKGLHAWGRHLISEYGGMVVETNSTVGRKDGVDVTRLTLLYRKPGYEIGDVVQWRHHIWRPSAWTKDGAIMERVDRRANRRDVAGIWNKPKSSLRNMNSFMLTSSTKMHLWANSLTPPRGHGRCTPSFRPCNGKKRTAHPSRRCMACPPVHGD